MQKIVEESQGKAWRHNWGFDAPKAEKVATIFYNAGRDPDLYLISEYSEKGIQALRQLTIWTKVEGTAAFLSTSIASYERQIQDLYDEDAEHYQQLFKDHPVTFTKDSLYFTQRKEDGSYIIAVLNPDERKLYTLEMFF
ncbi:hypothetical protein BVG16_12170 [Paenibacillus selenitireducens]|uniref:Uncharacterized protein n=1 Tax=Paenibacillus selenitireducens TaxID=1324314 RepID=A0A1T2XFE8_9BACL|nr:hypothetical protein [Paenibacillus selenitireducens]OPA78614.1 hypothetical protein BVG16_12170 [Paenibacillus selenitireducens]